MHTPVDRLLDMHAVLEAGPAVAGAKAFNLARVAAAGIRVPEGVVVPAAAAGRPVDDTLVDDVTAAIGPIEAGAWAVRSSGAAEDGNERSFAGQFASVLGVTDRASLKAALARCAASASSETMRAYAAGAQPLALLVQRMVAATAAGVAFSADPVTGARDVVVINAVRGLGDRLAAGEVTPDEIAVRGGEVTMPGADAAISTEQARVVAGTVRRLEQLFGHPQDVEWAFDGDRLVILQSRPITRLPPAPVPIPVEPPPGTWTRNDHHATLSPLMFELFGVYDAAQAQAMRKYAMPIAEVRSVLIGGHLYTRFLVEGASARVPPPWVMWLASRLAPSLRRMNRTADRVFREKLLYREVSEWEARGRAHFDARIAAFAPDEIPTLDDAGLLDRIGRARALLVEGLRAHADTMGHHLAVADFGAFCQEHLGWGVPAVVAALSGAAGATTAMRDELAALTRRHVRESTPERLLQLADERGEGLWTECAGLKAAVDTWIREEGLRMQDYDLRHPTLRETPDVVYGTVRDVLRGLAANGEVSRPAGAARAERLAEARRRLGGTPLAGDFEERLAWAQKAYSLRDENGLYTVSRPCALLRLHLLELGRRIPSIGTPDDVFYLRFAELEAAFSGRLENAASLVARRRGEEQWARTNRGPRVYGPPEPPPPAGDPFPPPLRRLFKGLAWMMESMEPAEDPDRAGSRTLSGRGASPGRRTGRARVVAGPQDFGRLAPGDVLVCRVTSPAWSVLFSRVGAIVTDEGGFLSHPAIIAREFGVPAVVGTESATIRIRDGARVTVDGTAGEVELED